MSDPDVIEQALDGLRRTVARIEDPANWCTRAAAKDSFGEAVRPESHSACRWCLSGAMDRETRGGPPSVGVAVWGYLYQATRFEFPQTHSYLYINDILGHAAVLTIGRRAIELAEADLTGARPADDHAGRAG